MSIRNRIDALMARFGYVRAPAGIVPTVIPMTIQFDTDTSKVETAKKLLEEVVATAERAEAAVRQLNIAAGTECAAANASAARSATTRACEDFAPIVAESAAEATPPAGAKAGYWLKVFGRREPVWIETPLPSRKPSPASGEASGLRFPK